MMKFVGVVLIGLVIMAVTRSELLGFVVAMFSYFALDRLDLDWLRK